MKTSLLVILILSFTKPIFGQKGFSDTLYFAKPSYGEYPSGYYRQFNAWGFGRMISPNYNGKYDDWNAVPSYSITGGVIKLSNGQIRKGAPVGKWTSSYPTGELFEEAEYDTLLIKETIQSKQSQDVYIPEEYTVRYKSRLIHYQRYYKNGQLQEKFISYDDNRYEETFYYRSGNEYLHQTINSSNGHRKYTMYKPDKSVWREYEIISTNNSYKETEINYETKQKLVVIDDNKKKTHTILTYSLDNKLISKTIQKK